MRKTVSIVSPSVQKCTDNCPPPLLLSVPRNNGLVVPKTGCPLSLNLIIIQFSDSVPVSSWSVSFNTTFFPDPSPRNDQRPAGNLFANKVTSVALAIHSRSLSSDLHMMSLNIDMNISRVLGIVMGRRFGS